MIIILMQTTFEQICMQMVKNQQKTNKNSPPQSPSLKKTPNKTQSAKVNNFFFCGSDGRT